MVYEKFGLIIVIGYCEKTVIQSPKDEDEDEEELRRMETTKCRHSPDANPIRRQNFNVF